MPSVSDLLPLADIFARVPSDRVALVHGATRWTYGELEQRSASLAVWLVEKGAGQDDLIAFALPNGPDFVALTFAIYRCGATPAPLSPKLSQSERDAILATMEPRCFIENGELPDPGARASGGLPPIHIAASWKACTSGGSTGRPKVIVDGRPAGFTASTDFIAIPANSVVLVPGPLYHNAPFSAAVFALSRGNTVVTMPRFDAASALAIIAAERVSWAIMVPTMLHRTMALTNAERDSHDLSAWQTVVHTAAPMAPWLKQAWIDWRGPDHICEVYGATEGLVRCWIGGRDWLKRPGSVGFPMGGARLRITAADGSEAAQGELGEVYAMPPGGPGSSYRYIGAERRAIAGGWESVGDMGWVDPEGYLYLADRKDDLIISGGVNIWPSEVEAALLQHPEIASCAVHGLADSDLGQRVHAVIESRSALTAEQLGVFLSDHLARAKHPRSITLTRDPVRDDAGKFRKPRPKETT